MKKNAFLFLLPFLLLTACAFNMHTAGVAKSENYRAVKRIALLPASYEKSFVADRMDKINYQAVEPLPKEGYVVIGVDKIKRFLGSGYTTFAKKPMNKKVMRKIARKFNIEAVVYCEINEWQQDASLNDGSGKVLNKVSLTYTLFDAKTLKQLAKNSGSNQNTDVLSEESVANTVAKELAAKLIKSVL